MSGQPFTFPPPPPAPPQVSQSYAAYSQPQQGSHGYGARQNRGGRGRWDHARGGNRGGSRGGSFGSSHVTSSHGGYPMGNTRQLGSQNAEFGTQHASQEQDGYPLPNYPPVQLPQYPPNIRQDYGQQTSNFTQNSSSQHSQMRYPSHDQHAQQYYSGQQPCPPHGYGSPANGVHSAAQSPPRMSSQPQNFNGFASQPEPMGAAMRMGFQDDRQSHHSQTLPQPTSSGTIPFPNGSPNSNDSAYQNNDFQNFQHGSRGFQNPFPGHRGRGQKRGYGEAFGRSKPRPQAPPAVPSFGSALSLPVKPPAPQDHSRKSRKKKRKHNQLGLTPKAEEHESSEEEEDDVDEESKLAAAAAGFDPRSQLLQFEYKGRTSTLHSSSDIAAWIEERRKRFPTKARAAEAVERRRQRDEAQNAANQARREYQEKQRAEAKGRQRLKAEADQKRKKPKENAEDVAVKAKRKVEKLRRQLEKEEKRAAKAEAKAFKTELEAHPEAYEKAESKDAKKRKRSDSGESCNAKVADTNTIKPEEQNRIALDGADIKVESDTQAPKENIVAAGTHEIGSNGALHESREAHSPSGPLTPTSQPRAPDEDVDAKILSINHDGHPGGPDEDSCKAVGFSNEAVDVGIERTTQESKLSVSDSSSESSSTDSEDLTSSSGSSSSASDSDEDTPQQTSSKRNGPERVAPPKRERSNQICKDFLKSGRCRRGDNCRFRHELPERGSRAAGRREDKKTQERTERVSLHQRLVEQEKEKEDHDILRAIIHLGEKGSLEPEIPKGNVEN